MTKVIGVRFRTAGKVYFFNPLQLEIKRGDHVIVETARGIEFGTVVAGVHEVEDDKVIQPLKPVMRIAGERDIEQEAANKEKEKEAFKICKEKILKHGLEMKLIDAEYTFDNNKVLFYFTADGRIDFRELVKDLASVFKTRIELRQIGVRDETKIRGGIGICGRPLCCHSYLSDFVPVSIKMAKEQNLSLNPTKISGVCGRLMCCLKNEEDTYEELNRKLPGVGDYVQTADGLHGEVQSVNVLRQLVKVLVEAGDEKELKEYEADTLQFKRRRGKKGGQELSKEEQKELEKLEEIEEKEEAEERAEKRAEQRQDRREQRTDGENRGDNRGENRRRDGRRDDNRRNNNRGENNRNGEHQNRNDNRGGDNGSRNENRRDNNRGDRRRENRPDQVRENGNEQSRSGSQIQQEGGNSQEGERRSQRDNSSRRRPRHGRIRRCRRPKRTPSRPRPILRKTAIRTALETVTETIPEPAETAETAAITAETAPGTAATAATAVATTPETTSQTEPNNRRNDRRRQARHPLIDGNRRQPERQPAKQPQKTLWRQRIPSLPPQCVSASSNYRIAMADTPGRSVVCHIAIFDVRRAAMAGRRASLHTPRFHRRFPRNRQSPRFPNDAPDHARVSHTGIRHQPTRDANATSRRHRSAAAVPSPCGMGRADD